MRHFFVKPDNIDLENKTILIHSQEDINHILNVLRMNIGDFLHLMDGRGNTYLSKISSINKKQILCAFTEIQCNRNNKRTLNITLAYGLIKAPKEEMILQKCTEIGVNTFQPLITAYTNKKSDHSEPRLKRLERICEEASKQCHRTTIPTILKATPFTTLIEHFPRYDKVITCLPNIQNLQTAPNDKNINNILIIIGSEGGFSEEETALLKKNAAEPLSLGDNILRTETAAIVACGIVLHDYNKEHRTTDSSG